jgi:phosphoenolpyruvate carboxykinase (ATP)
MPRPTITLPGLAPTRTVRANLAAPLLIEAAVARGEGRLAASGALVVNTGQHTGRSAGDKYVVEEPSVRDLIDWGTVNQPLPPDRFAMLRGRVAGFLAGQDLFVQDLYAGADPAHRIRVRLVTTGAWHALFARNMFIRPAAEDLPGFTPDWTILHAPGFRADPRLDGTRGDCAIALSFDWREVVICGTSYAGEIKKSIFTVMNHLLPERGVLPMHCSANVGAQGDVALFFGLSGTGKTTLSSDQARRLIGDDEHGWSEAGTFNLEGGCYAKVIRLDPEAEPQIWSAMHRFGTVLENVVVDESTGVLDLEDARHTENTRACYPIEFIEDALPGGCAGQPRNLFMLTADAFGVLPPIARLTPEQAMYHFLSGYTARVAGTEKGLGAEPKATFSACFGAPFLPRPPSVYGRMLAERIARHGAACWLVNTGWTGGAYGVGRRMRIADTRALLAAALDGSLARAPMRKDPFFGFAVPTVCPGVDPRVLDPRATWEDGAAYDAAARELVGRFERNFERFASEVDDGVREAAIRAAA